MKKNKDDYKKAHPLHYAASIGDTTAITSILSKNPISIHNLDGKGRTPLHWAARNGHTTLCRLLITTYHAEPNAISLSSSSSSSSSPSIIISTPSLINGGKNNNNNYNNNYISDIKSIKTTITTTTIIDNNNKTTPLSSSSPSSTTFSDDGVTPLELAVWKGHLSTTKELISLGANPNRINGYGCGIVHWCALSTSYNNTGSSSSSPLTTTTTKPAIVVSESFRRGLSLARYLSLQLTITTCRRQNNNNNNNKSFIFATPNHHGQTPLHKAAYAGNLPMLYYLIGNSADNTTMRLVDDMLDSDGNTAADCAERAGKMTVARWVRRYASPVWRRMVEKLELEVDYDEEIVMMDDDDAVSLSLRLPRPPSMERIRKAYRDMTKRVHPDATKKKNGVVVAEGVTDVDNGGYRRWFEIYDAYRILNDWWVDEDRYDDCVRQITRNENLIDVPPLLLTNGGCCDEQASNNIVTHEVAKVAHDDNTTALGATACHDELSLFRMRLKNILLIPHYSSVGLPIDRLPRLYKKSYPGETVPNPKEYKCRKLVHLLKRRCADVCRVDYCDDQVILRPYYDDKNTDTGNAEPIER